MRNPLFDNPELLQAVLAERDKRNAIESQRKKWRKQKREQRARKRFSSYIALLWHVDDVKGLRPDLDDTQAMEVLERFIS